MSQQRCTVWSRQPVSAVALASAFSAAAERLGLSAGLTVAGQVRPSSADAWKSVIDSFPPYEFAGEARWSFLSGDTVLQDGKLYWPIRDLFDVRASLQFDFGWDGARSKRYQFRDVGTLVGFLHVLGLGMSPTSLLVEPRRLPDEVLNMRLDRHDEIHAKVTLTNADWVFGLSTEDPQCKRLESSGVPFAAVERGGGFAVYAIANAPLDYDSPADMEVLRRVEAAIGVI